MIAQRLVRKRCPKCGGNATRFCDCHQGYKGRIGVYQFLQPDVSQAHGYQLDFQNLYASALEKVTSQVTDLAEVQRVLGQPNA